MIYSANYWLIGIVIVLVAFAVYTGLVYLIWNQLIVRLHDYFKNDSTKNLKKVGWKQAALIAILLALVTSFIL